MDEKQQSRLYYMVAYPDKESREKMFVNGIAKDPEFLRVVAESERGGEANHKHRIGAHGSYRLLANQMKPGIEVA